MHLYTGGAILTDLGNMEHFVSLTSCLDDDFGIMFTCQHTVQCLAER